MKMTVFIRGNDVYGPYDVISRHGLPPLHQRPQCVSAHMYVYVLFVLMRIDSDVVLFRVWEKATQVPEMKCCHQVGHFAIVLQQTRLANVCPHQKCTLALAE